MDATGLRELVEAVERRDDRPSWDALAREARRRGRLPEEIPRERAFRRGMELLAEEPGDRDLVALLELGLGIEAIRGELPPAPPAWQEDVSRRVRDQDEYDGRTGIPLWWRRPVDGAVMLLVPAGTIPPPTEVDPDEVELADPDAEPVSPHVGPFLLDVAPVPVRAYAAFLEAHEGQIRPVPALVEMEPFGWAGQTLDPDAPVRGLPPECADAYARWARARIPARRFWQRLGKGRALARRWGLEVNREVAEWLEDRLTVQEATDGEPFIDTRIHLRTWALPEVEWVEEVFPLFGGEALARPDHHRTGLRLAIPLGEGPDHRWFREIAASGWRLA